MVSIPAEYGAMPKGANPIEHFVTIGIRQGRALTRRGLPDGLFHRLMCRTLLAGDNARAISQDRFLMHLDLLDGVRSFAGEVRGAAAAASTVISLRPPNHMSFPRFACLTSRTGQRRS